MSTLLGFYVFWAPWFRHIVPRLVAKLRFKLSYHRLFSSDTHLLLLVKKVQTPPPALPDEPATVPSRCMTSLMSGGNHAHGKLCFLSLYLRALSSQSLSAISLISFMRQTPNVLQEKKTSVTLRRLDARIRRELSQLLSAQ